MSFVFPFVMHEVLINSRDSAVSMETNLYPPSFSLKRILGTNTITVLLHMEMNFGDTCRINYSTPGYQSGLHHHVQFNFTCSKKVFCYHSVFLVEMNRRVDGKDKERKRHKYINKNEHTHIYM